MQTKAELEDELNDLRLRVAELEGAVAAYRFVLSQNPPQPLTPNDSPWWMFSSPLSGTFSTPCTTFPTVVS